MNFTGIKSLTWIKWLQRNFNPFMISLFKNSTTRKYYKEIGFPNAPMKAMMYQQGCFYESQEVWKDFAVKLGQSKTSLFEITKSLKKFHTKSVQRIKQLTKSKDSIKALSEFYEIISINVVYIWLAHGLEEYYKLRLSQEVPNYIKENVDKFVGDASLPKKKNAHALMEDAIRKGKNQQNIAKKFGWLKARGFGDPFTAEDIKNIAKDLHPTQAEQKVTIPKPLKPLFKEVQELVFFRTARTDVFYELLFKARPIWKKVAKQYEISWEELPHYTIQSLIEGKPKRYTENITLALYEDESYFGEIPLLSEQETEMKQQVERKVAFVGKITGTAKIIHNSSELDKVKGGDILVTQMTFPAFIPAMVRASAFVTDEGGITCHAAIVAREMKKPCVIGTKHATKIFKDGDIIEVDAEKGIVRKIR